MQFELRAHAIAEVRLAMIANIEGAEKVTRIPFSQHDLGAAEIAALGAVLQGPILTTGDTVADFERRFADALGVPHAVSVTSCTAAVVALYASMPETDADAVAARLQHVLRECRPDSGAR